MSTSQYTPNQAPPAVMPSGSSVLDKGKRPALPSLQQLPVATAPAITGALGNGWLPHQLGKGHAPAIPAAAPTQLGTPPTVPTQPGLEAGGAAGSMTNLGTYNGSRVGGAARY